MVTVSTALPVEAEKLPSPAYAAVMVCLPTASDETVSEAWPRLSTATATGLPAPTVKVTAPVGVRLEVGWLTVAVMISAFPLGEGFSEVATTRVVAATTFWTVTAADPDEVADVYQASALASGWYTPVMVG